VIEDVASTPGYGRAKGRKKSLVLVELATNKKGKKVPYHASSTEERERMVCIGQGCSIDGERDIEQWGKKKKGKGGNNSNRSLRTNSKLTKKSGAVMKKGEGPSLRKGASSAEKSFRKISAPVAGIFRREQLPAGKKEGSASAPTEEKRRKRNE